MWERSDYVYSFNIRVSRTSRKFVWDKHATGKDETLGLRLLMIDMVHIFTTYLHVISNEKQDGKEGRNETEWR